MATDNLADFMSANGQGQTEQKENEKEEKKKPKQKTEIIAGTIEDIEFKQTAVGKPFKVLYVAGHKISSFEDPLTDFDIGDEVEVEFVQKGVFKNLLKISHIEKKDDVQNTTNEGVQSNELSASKKFCEENKIMESISFRDGQSRTLKLLGDEMISITNVNGEIVKGILYTVEENGKLKNFFTASPRLILTLSKLCIGDVVKIQMKHKNVGGRIQSYYEVQKISNQ